MSTEYRPFRINSFISFLYSGGQAYESISDGLGRTASSLVGNPIKTYQRGAGVGSALASAARAAPAAAIGPASATAHAVHCALLGVRNRSSIKPHSRISSLPQCETV